MFLKDDIVKFIEYFDTRDMLYIVMELVRGRTLCQLIAEDSPLPVQQVKNISKQIVSDEFSADVLNLM